MRLCLWSSLLCCLCSECLIKKSCEWRKKKNQTATKTLVDFPIFFNLLELLCLPATVSLQMSYFTRHSMFSSASTLIQFSPVRFCSINGNLEVLCCYYCFYYCCFVCVCIEVNWMTASASDALQWKVFRWRQFIGYSSSSFAYIRLMSGTAGSACLPVSVCLCFWPASKCHQKHRFFFAIFLVVFSPYQKWLLLLLLLLRPSGWYVWVFAHLFDDSLLLQFHFSNCLLFTLYFCFNQTSRHFLRLFYFDSAVHFAANWLFISIFSFRYCCVVVVVHYNPLYCPALASVHYTFKDEWRERTNGNHKRWLCVLKGKSAESEEGK